MQRKNILLTQIFQFTIEKWIKETMVKFPATLIAGTFFFFKTGRKQLKVILESVLGTLKYL